MATDEPIQTERSRFRTTRWSLVVAAGRASEDGRAQAVAELCELYWYPAYAFIRRRGYSHPDAQDLTQAFFAQLIDKDYVAKADHNLGTFRTFLLTAVSRFVSKERDRSTAQKRGGGVKHLLLDFESAEGRYTLEPSDEVTAEHIYERSWAIALLENVLSQVEREYESTGKAEHFNAFVGYLDGRSEVLPYSALAEQLDLSTGAVKVAVHRMRRRYGEILRGEIAETVSRPEEVNQEIQHFIEILSR